MLRLAFDCHQCMHQCKLSFPLYLHIRLMCHSCNAAIIWPCTYRQRSLHSQSVCHNHDTYVPTHSTAADWGNAFLPWLQQCMMASGGLAVELSATPRKRTAEQALLWPLSLMHDLYLQDRVSQQSHAGCGRHSSPDQGRSCSGSHCGCGLHLHHPAVAKTARAWSRCCHAFRHQVHWRPL